MAKKMAKEQLIKKYETLLETMISDSDFARWIPNVEGKIMKYNKLQEYDNINELLPEPFDFRIILTEQKQNEGHWCCLLKYKNIIEWFDPYGVRPDGEWNYIPSAIKHALGQGGNPLSKLLKTIEKGQKVYYNKRRIQSTKEGINTCGRWVICRILSAMLGWELDDFINKVDECCEENGKPSDIVVCDWIH